MYFLMQEISSHQEQFIQMLNEPNPDAVPASGGGVAGGVGGMGRETAGGSQMSYIQVTPQEKEAIERVRRSRRRRSMTLQPFPLISKFSAAFTDRLEN